MLNAPYLSELLPSPDDLDAGVRFLFFFFGGDSSFAL